MFASNGDMTEPWLVPSSEIVSSGCIIAFGFCRYLACNKKFFSWNTAGFDSRANAFFIVVGLCSINVTIADFHSRNNCTSYFASVIKTSTANFIISFGFISPLPY